jgi:hypothetical protein
MVAAGDAVTSDTAPPMQEARAPREPRPPREPRAPREAREQREPRPPREEPAAPAPQSAVAAPEMMGFSEPPHVEDVPVESIPIAVKPAESLRAPPPLLPVIASTLPPDSGLELVETRFAALPPADESSEPPRPRRVRPPRVEVASEPLEIIETRKESPPPSG